MPIGNELHRRRHRTYEVASQHIYYVSKRRHDRRRITNIHPTLCIHHVLRSCDDTGVATANHHRRNLFTNRHCYDRRNSRYARRSDVQRPLCQCKPFTHSQPPSRPRTSNHRHDIRMHMQHTTARVSSAYAPRCRCHGNANNGNSQNHASENNNNITATPTKNNNNNNNNNNSNNNNNNNDNNNNHNNKDHPQTAYELCTGIANGFASPRHATSLPPTSAIACTQSLLPFNKRALSQLQSHCRDSYLIRYTTCFATPPPLSTSRPTCARTTPTWDLYLLQQWVSTHCEQHSCSRRMQHNRNCDTNTTQFQFT